MPHVYNIDNDSNYLAQIHRVFYDLGYNVLPLDGDSKITARKWGRHSWGAKSEGDPDESRFQIQRVTSQQLKSWNQQFAKWALLTGKSSTDAPGLVVVDADNEEARALVEKRCAATPLYQDTARKGGRHYVFRRPDGIHYLRSRSKASIDGVKYEVDLRADAGILKLHGKFNQPITLDLLNSLPVYDPAWLPFGEREQNSDGGDGTYEAINHEEAIEDIRVPLDDRIEAAKRHLERTPGAKEGQGAHNYLFAITMDLLWGYALPNGACQELLEEWGQREDQQNSHGGYYPWNADEIRHKITSGLRAVYDGEVGDSVMIPHADERMAEMSEGIDFTQGDYTSMSDEDIIKALVPDPEARKDKRRAYLIRDLVDLKSGEPVVADHIMEGSEFFLYGQWGAMKTFFALDLCLSVAYDIPFLGRYPVQKLPVAYIIGEGYAGIRKRIVGWQREHHVGDTEHFVVLPARFDVPSRTEVGIALMQAYKELHCLPQLVVFDTLAKHNGGRGVNSPEEMQAFTNGMELCQDLVERLSGFRPCVGAIHHEGKDSTRGMMGSNLAGANVDSVIRITKTADDKITVKFVKNKDGNDGLTYDLKSHHVELPEELDRSGQGTLVLRQPQATGEQIISALCDFLPRSFEEAKGSKETVAFLQKRFPLQKWYKDKLRMFVEHEKQTIIQIKNYGHPKGVVYWAQP